MAYATYQKQRVIEVASMAAQKYRSRIAEHDRAENERKEKRIQDAMRPRWWRGSRTREKAEKIVQREELDLCRWSWPKFLWLPYDDAIRAERLLQTAQTTDGDLVTLTDDDVAFLFS